MREFSMAIIMLIISAFTANAQVNNDDRILDVLMQIIDKPNDVTQANLKKDSDGRTLSHWSYLDSRAN